MTYYQHLLFSHNQVGEQKVRWRCTPYPVAAFMKRPAPQLCLKHQCLPPPAPCPGRSQLKWEAACVKVSHYYRSLSLSLFISYKVICLFYQQCLRNMFILLQGTCTVELCFMQVQIYIKFYDRINFMIYNLMVIAL